MDAVDPKSVEYALSKIEDGFIFERFAQEFLSAVLGKDFVPVGGIHDKGIDGFTHTFSLGNHAKSIYQMSIEKSPDKKIEETLTKLENNHISYDMFVYVTNQSVRNQDQLIDHLWGRFNKPVRIFDVMWFSHHVNNHSGALSAYHYFTSNYLHEFSKPGKSYEIGDLTDDPRLFVFLRQQWEENRRDLSLDKILADSLILYSLEGTDPDKKIFKTSEQIKELIGKLIKFDPKQLYPTIKERLSVISKKPQRQINFHPDVNGYCLPYETRIKIQDRNLSDLAIYEEFAQEAEKIIMSHLRVQNVKVKDCLSLVENSIRQLYYQQGLEFANFILKGENIDAIEKNVSDIVSKVVDESAVVIENRQKVKAALTLTIRDIVYKGNNSQKEFLKKLSSTYVMLFLLQCDPKIATYFSALSSKLEVYVCTSIIIPALSEYHLDPANRRHWNLLKGARSAGVTLVIDENIVKEIISHFESIKYKYANEYKNLEEIYMDELQMLYIDEIMIRAYFYARMNNKVSTFDEFLDSFVNPDLSGAEEALIEWLKEEFGITYRSSKALGIKLDTDEEKVLLEKLAPLKRNHIAKAKNDIRIILTIYALREKNNEASDSGIFGYRTWWLSKDTTTFRVVNELFKDKYKLSCYIRPDFLYNYISLAPSIEDVDSVYQNLFPSLIGANISFHLSQDLLDFIHSRIAEHKQKTPGRIKAILRELSEKLKYDPAYQTRAYVGHYLDEKLKEIEEYQS